ncbi:MAG: hypothetical protein PHQ02_09250, partial [Candidatus Riflebacteria bacterium]|nr:hypothetical protein [Candidatus Riflebacteria bacterium]
MKNAKNKLGFSMTEIMVIVVVASMMATMGYKIMSTVFSHFSKSQSKLTNLRMANVAVERIKSDIRSAVIPASESEKPKIEDKKCSFCITDNKGKNTRSMVEYEFKNNALTRTYNGESRNLTGKVQITDMKFSEVVEEESK